MGGDWNDGMNRSGGKGESVWLGWFLYTTIAAFMPHVDARKQKMRGNRYRKHLENLRKSLEERPGMATGIAVLISTTARRWVRREMKSVASIRSRSRGR